MRSIRSALLLALAGSALAGAAVAAADTAHLLTVRLPDGSVERIRYVGDVAPVVLVPARGDAALDPVAAMFGGADSPFALMDRISADMDRQASAMVAQAAALADRTPALDGTAVHMVSAGAMPAGTTSYSVVSTTVNGRTCTRGSRLIAGSAGAAPRLISQSSGDCAAVAAAPAGPAMTAAPAAPAAPAKVTPVRMVAPPPRGAVPAGTI